MIIVDVDVTTTVEYPLQTTDVATECLPACGLSCC